MSTLDYSTQLPRVLQRPHIKGDSSLSVARVLKQAIQVLEDCETDTSDDDMCVIIGNMQALLKAVA